MMMASRAPWPAAPGAETVDDLASRTVPFDYVFRFQLKGEPQHTLRQTVTVSVEASFTAVSIGYGAVPEVTPVIFGPTPRRPLSATAPALLKSPPIALRDVTFGDLMDALEVAIANAPDVPRGMPALEAALRNGIKLNADLAQVGLLDNGRAVLEPSLLQQLFQIVSAPVKDVQFLYALIDEGSGREFQSDPILNVAGLGASDGRRPFRYFAQPILFAPLATIRMDITELSAFRGELHVSLHGYKVLGGAGTPTEVRSHRARRGGR